MKHDEDFRRRFNEALDSLQNEEEVEQVLRLNSARRREWLSLSPTARRVQLKVWSEEESFIDQVEGWSDQLETYNLRMRKQREERRHQKKSSWFKRWFLWG